MSMIALVMSSINATRADVVRVLNHGGSTEADWAIAHAIEAVTGRSAYELMMLAGRDAEVAEIWADSRAEADPVAPTNPRAVYDPEITVYPEHTSPEEDREVIAHHPHIDEADEVLVDAPDVAPGTAAWEELKATVVWAEAARLTGQHCPGVVSRIISPWQSASQAIEGLSGLLKARRPKHSRPVLAA